MAPFSYAGRTLSLAECLHRPRRNCFGAWLHAPMPLNPPFIEAGRGLALSPGGIRRGLL